MKADNVCPIPCFPGYGGWQVGFINETEKQRNKKQRNRETEKQRKREAEKQRNREAERQRNREREIQAVKKCETFMVVQQIVYSPVKFWGLYNLGQPTLIVFHCQECETY